MVMNSLNKNKYLFKSSISLQINIVNNLIRHNSDNHWGTIMIITNTDFPCWLICKNGIVSTLVNLVKKCIDIREAINVGI